MMRGFPFEYLLVIFVSLGLGRRASADPAERFALEPSDHIVIVGNTFAERMALSGYFDALAYAAHPNHQLVIRNVPWSADEVALRPREMNVPTMEDHLANYEADVIVMSFGMSESFNGAAGLGIFEQQLNDQLTTFAGTSYNGSSPPKLILISPITHEDLGAPMLTGRDLQDRNDMLRQYVQVMRQVAQSHDVRFIDLFEPSSYLYQREIPQLTSNGIHPNERGYFHLVQEIAIQLGWMDGAAPKGQLSASAARLRRLAFDKHYHQRLLYHPTNTEYVFGRRHKPYGVVNFPPEMLQLQRMIEAREHAIWEMNVPTPAELFASAPTSPAIWEDVPTSQGFPEDSWSAPAVEAKGQENSLGNLNILPPDEFAKSFTIADGYAIECFASEQDFEELENPLAMTFDARGRLWVLCAPTYPHLIPGEAPRCKLLIIEDTDHDGKADRRTVFADQLYIPTGFAIDTDAVYIGQAPDLWKFTDTNGDDRADRREIVASGFGMPDSHHQISAFEWDPNGGILLHEGVFTKSNVETPYGTQRTNGAAVWRYDPRTQQLQVMSHCNFANPWGHAFDDYGQSVLADASGGDNYSFSHVIMPYEYPNKPKRVGRFLNRGRPTAGCELIASRHFPDDVQDSFLVNQSIGFHGTRWSKTTAVDSAWTAEPMPQDLLQSSDTNFRPVAMEIGPDGALYIADWCNPLVGHMQYSVRDPRRNHTHGRIWRIRHAKRPLVSPPTIEHAPVVVLLEHLRLPERNTRQLARRRLQRAPASQVFPELTKWMAELDHLDPLHDRLLLEALWIHQAHGRVDLELAYRVAMLTEPRARAGAIRVVRHWLQQRVIDEDAALPLLQRAIEDEDMRVRLEGVLACGFYPGVAGASVAAVAAELEMDEGLRIALQETLAYLLKYGEPQSQIVIRLRLERTDLDELLAQPLDELVASVMLLGHDVPQRNRSEALAFLAGDSGAARAQRLVAEMMAARRFDLAIAPLLLEMSPQDLAAAADELNRAASSDNLPLRALAIAALVRIAPGNATLIAGDAILAIEVLSLLSPGQAPASAVSQLRDATDAGMIDTRRATEQVARHSSDDTELFIWLAERVDAVSEKGLHTFDQAHAAAMAALRAMNHLPTARWPQGYDSYRVAPVSNARLESGRAIYLDEINGCARCHGVNGRGEEGFPPLDRSPWVLGDPHRAAAVVIHGLYGELRLPDGRRFNSVMAPLGANLDDQQVADVLTYVRQSWGNYGPAVGIDDVRRARQLKPQSEGSLMVDTLSRDYPLSWDRILASSTRLDPRKSAIVNPKTLFVITGSAIAGVLALILIASRLSPQSRRKLTS